MSYSFKEFLLNEEKRISVNADDPAAAKREIDRASKMDNGRVANMQFKDAATERSEVSKNRDAADPLSGLKSKRAAQAAALAATDKMIANKERAK